MITGNLCQHGIEFLLKAELLRQYSEAELADEKRFGHSLQRLWRAFKDSAQDTSLSKHGAAMQRLDRFEKIRYPGWPYGTSLVIAHEPSKKTDVKSQGGPSADKYVFRLEEVDELVQAIMPVLEMNPDWIKGDLARWGPRGVRAPECSSTLVAAGYPIETQVKLDHPKFRRRGGRQAFLGKTSYHRSSASRLTVSWVERPCYLRSLMQDWWRSFYKSMRPRSGVYSAGLYKDGALK